MYVILRFTLYIASVGKKCSRMRVKYKAYINSSMATTFGTQGETQYKNVTTQPSQLNVNNHINYTPLAGFIPKIVKHL